MTVTVFYDATHEAWDIIWPELTRVLGRKATTEVHEFALTASGRVGGTVEPKRRDNGDNYFGPSIDMLHEAAGKASAATGRSVDWFLRIYTTASERVQKGADVS